MTRKSARPEKTALIIARRIVAEVAAKGLQPGDRLPSEQVMLAEYGVGRGTLRESLRYLELSGALSLKPGPGGGPTLEKPDASHLMDSIALLLQFDGASLDSILDARIGLEPMNARLSAERITDDRLAGLAAVVERTAASLDDLDAFHESSRDFHDGVARASGNALFSNLIDALTGLFAGPWFVDYPVGFRKVDLDAHRDVLAALTARDPDRTERAMRAHMTEMAAQLRERSPEMLARTVEWSGHR